MLIKILQHFAELSRQKLGTEVSNIDTWKLLETQKVSSFDNFEGFET